VKILNLDHIEQRQGNECFSSGDNNLDFSLEDFWSWSYSDLLNNVTRGCLAEFIVAKALGVELEVRNPWATYDLDAKTESEEPVKVEVKSAAYLQSWEQDKSSTIKFDIEKSQKLNFEKGIYEGEPQRHADVYVFALLKEEADKKKASRLDVGLWDFYVVPTFRLDNRTRSQESITLNSLKNEDGIKAVAVSFDCLRKAVSIAAAEQATFQKNKIQ